MYLETILYEFPEEEFIEIISKNVFARLAPALFIEIFVDLLRGSETSKLSIDSKLLVCAVRLQQFGYQNGGIAGIAAKLNKITLNSISQNLADQVIHVHCSM